MQTDKIEIVRTNIARFSSMSHISALKIQKTLGRHFQQVGLTTVDSREDLRKLVSLKPDLVFLGLKRLELPSDNDIEEVWLSDYLDQHGINYTGSQSLAIKLDFDKASAKTVIQRAGGKTAQFFEAQPDQYNEKNLPLQFPLFVKPLSTGGGAGIDDDSVVRTFKEYRDKVASIFSTYGTDSLVEEYLSGREFSVAILDDAMHEQLHLMPIEIITTMNANGDRILGSRVKTEDYEEVIGVTDQPLRDHINKLAIDAYRALGGRDLGRIDIRLDAHGQAHFIEANFVPGPGTRYFAGACLINKGMSYEATILKIVELALSRAEAVSTDQLSLDEPEIIFTAANLLAAHSDLS